MSDIVQKILIDMETRKANDELSKLARMSNSTGEAVERMTHRAQELQKSIDDIKKATGPTQRELSSLSREMEKLNKSAGSVQSGMSSMINNIKFEKLASGIKQIGGELGGMAKGLIDATANGAQMGSAFGPLGAVIGGVAGAIKGITTNILASEAAWEKQRKQIEEQGEAYWDQVHALERKRIVEGSLADIARQIAVYEAQWNEQQQSTSKILNNSADSYRRLTGDLSAYEGRLVEAREALRQDGGPREQAEVDRAERALRNVKLEIDTIEKGYSDVRVAAEKAENERKDRINDLALALGQQGLSQKTYNKLLKEYNDLTSGATDKTRALARELAKIGRELAGGESPTDRAIRQGATERSAFKADVDRAVEQMYRDEAFANRTVLGDDTVHRQVGFSVELPNESDWEQLRQNLRDLQSNIAGENRQQTLFESIFGPVSEIDLYKQSLEALGATLTGFTDAAGAGYQALVTGSQPIGQAMKAAAAASILATGTASAVDAARETALGFGSLAWGPIGGVSAAAHFKSAALHASVAVGAGVVARGLGAGGGGGYAGAGSGRDQRSAGDGRGSGGNVTAGSTGDRNRPSPGVVVVYTDPFFEATGRTRRRMAQRAVKKALPRGSGWSDG